MKINYSYQISFKKLYFSIFKNKPKSNKDITYFSIENEPYFEYKNFFDDFGPPSLLQIYSFNKMIEEYFKNNNNILHFYCSEKQNIISNSILLICTYRLIQLNLTAEESFKPFKSLNLKPFRDASTLPSTFNLTIYDCLKGLENAIKLNWFNYLNFNSELWEYYEKIENGDMNWLIPNKLLAFASPYNQNILPNGYKVVTPDDIIPIFKNFGINHIIRLNKPFYNSNKFINSNFNFTDLYFLDGSNPPLKILNKFLSIIESNDIIGLHCKAGLGRTGTLAGCYIIKNFNFKPNEVIGWIRLCRAGSIIGQQQNFLINYFDSLNNNFKFNNNQLIKNLIYNPSKGIPLNIKNNNNKDLIRIKKPIENINNLNIISIPINYHPQPRKI